MANAPFIKVEATKFTEVGFVGKDVDQIIRDLMDVGMTIAKARALEDIKDKVAAQVEEKLLDCLVGPSNIQHNRDAFRKLLRMGHLDDRLIEIDVPERKCAQRRICWTRTWRAAGLSRASIRAFCEQRVAAIRWMAGPTSSP